MSSLIGKNLQGGKYKLEAVLGRGGFGLTFRAHQNYLDQVIVIKTLHESHWSAPNLSDLQRQFQDEARRLAMCSHPNVVRVSDFFIEDGLPYMVMDYIPGRSLADIVLPSNPLPVKASVDYISQIGRALQAVHARGLLHRDVKPQNIMIHQLTGEAVLIDFGIARELTQNPTQTHTSIVTEGYAPIEQYLPKAQRSAATDVYGLAATLYTLLTAEVPVAAVLRDRNPLVPIQQLRPDVKGPMADAIAQGMNIELKDRPQSVGRWLTMLSAKQTTGLFGRSGPVSPPTVPQKTAAASEYEPHPSEVPTRVAAPGYRSAPQGTTQKTVAMPIPTGYGETEYRPAPQSPPYVKPRSKGIGCGSVLGLITLGILGIAGGAGFWLYQQISEGISQPEFSLPEIEVPEVQLPTPDIEKAKADAKKKADALRERAEAEAASIAAAKKEAEEKAKQEAEAEAEPEYIPITEDSDPSVGAGSPPLVLANSGTTQPTGNNKIVPVPGFSPGTSEDKIRGRLGSPTSENSAGGYYTATYSLVPGRATLGYVYEEGSDRVKQSEAAFSTGVGRLLMRTTMIGMLDGRSSSELEKGLEAVRKGERDRVSINSGGFTGAIERNANGQVHIYVQR